MGATSKYPTSGDGGGSAPGFYQNALENAKQQVANVGQTQQAQAQPGQPPNRPGGGDSSLDAYNNYMSRYSPQGGAQPQQGAPSPATPQPNYTAMFGGDGSATPQEASRQAQRPPGGPPTGNPPQGPGNFAQDARRRQPGQKPPQGINMGAGYSNRSFG